MDIKDLEQIVGILKQNDVAEFELTEGDRHLKLSRAPKIQTIAVSAPSQHVDVQQAIHPVTPVPAGAAGAEPVAAVNEKLIRVESPLVGTFYRKPSPDSQPFVQEGQIVKKGDTLCIVEAMKLMNEIESTSDGKVEKILVGDGEVVEYGEVLFLINPAI